MPQQAFSPSQVDWITNQFNGTTYVPNSMDVQHEPLYDTITYAAAATITNLTQFFTAPSGKTLNQTNVQTAKRLDAPEAFTVMGIRLLVAENVLLSDLITFLNSFALEFWIGTKSYNRAPARYYCAGAGITGYTTTSGTSLYTNGVPGEANAHALAINIVIDNQASFYGQLDGVAQVLSSSGTGLVSVMLLDGLHARGVQ